MTFSYYINYSKPKVDKHDLDKLNEIADKYEDVNKYDMDDISKDYIKNRRNEMSFNKRNDEFIKNHSANKVIKDDRYYAWVDEVDPNSELTESELEQMYRSIYPNRIKK